MGTAKETRPYHVSNSNNSGTVRSGFAVRGVLSRHSDNDFTAVYIRCRLSTSRHCVYTSLCRTVITLKHKTAADVLDRNEKRFVACVAHRQLLMAIIAIYVCE